MGDGWATKLQTVSRTSLRLCRSLARTVGTRKPVWGWGSTWAWLMICKRVLSEQALSRLVASREWSHCLLRARPIDHLWLLPGFKTRPCTKVLFFFVSQMVSIRLFFIQKNVLMIKNSLVWFEPAPTTIYSAPLPTHSLCHNCIWFFECFFPLSWACFSSDSLQTSPRLLVWSIVGEWLCSRHLLEEHSLYVDCSVVSSYQWMGDYICMYVGEKTRL